MLSASPLPQGVLAEAHAFVQHVLGQPTLSALRVARAVPGVFFTGVQLDNAVGGLCATPFRNAPGGPRPALAQPLDAAVGRRATELLQDLHAPQGLRRAFAIATLNALAETLWQREGPPADARLATGDAFDALQIAPGQHVVLVGAFPPYLQLLRRSGQPFQVLELDPAALQPEELPFFVPAAQAPQTVARADVLITTGTTLLNDTLDGLLAHRRQDAKSAVVGPTTPLVAAPFARRGVSVVGGTRVRAPAALLDFLATGGAERRLPAGTVERVCLCPLF